MFYNICRCHLVAAVLVFCGLAYLPSTTSAQDLPVAFVHGLGADESAWPESGEALESQFVIDALYPDLGWTSVFGTQESQLHSFLYGEDDIPGVGHSNGGLISRYHVQRRGAGSSLNRVLAMQSPHAGAPLADAALSGYPLQFAVDLFYSVRDAYQYYATYDPNFPVNTTRYQGVYYSALNMMNVAQAIPASMGGRLGLFVPALSAALGIAVPVLDQMGPSSPFILDLNSSAELQQEAAYTTDRVGVATTANPNAVVSRLLFPSVAGVVESARWGLRWSASLLYSHYKNHPDIFLRSNAWRWARVAQITSAIDLVWLNWVGVLEGAICYSTGCFGYVSASDGVVPLTSQRYPGATTQYHLGIESTRPGGILHTQKHHPHAQVRYSDVFRYEFNIPVQGLDPIDPVEPPSDCAPYIICPPTEL